MPSFLSISRTHYLRGPARACCYSYYESLADDGFISSYTSQQVRLGLAAWTWRSHSLNPLSSPSIVQSCKRVNKAVPTLLSSGISVTSLCLLISYYSNRTKILLEVANQPRFKPVHGSV